MINTLYNLMLRIRQLQVA